MATPIPAPPRRPLPRVALLALATALAASGCAGDRASPGTETASASARASATVSEAGEAAVRTAGSPALSAVPGAVPPAAEAAAPELAAIAERLARPSPSAAAVEAFAAICAEPVRGDVARAARRRGFEAMPAERLRGDLAGAALPDEAEAWRGPAEVAGAVLLWDAATSTCELRARGVDPVVVGSEFTKLARTLEDTGSSVMRLAPPPARPGAPRTRQMLLVQPGGSGRAERARVLRFGEDGAAGARDAVSLSARGLSAAR